MEVEESHDRDDLEVSRHVHGQPVVDSRGGLAGFVSTMDVMAWLAGLR
jgi:hypothetical protein